MSRPFAESVSSAGVDMSIIVPIPMAVGRWAVVSMGGQAEYVRVPYADRGLNRIPDTVSDEQALLVGDVLATGFWGCPHLGDLRGGYGFHYWRWSYGDLYFVVRVVEEATTYYCLREVSGKGPVRSPALSGSLGDRSRKL